MARNKYTFLHTILDVVRDKLVSALAIDETLVTMRLSEEPAEPAPADQYIALVPGPQSPDQAAVYGGGNTTPILNGNFAVLLWTRLYLDQTAGAATDEQLLTNTTYGSLEMMRKIMKALQLYDPTDGAGDNYLCEPMRLANGGWMTRPKRRAEELGWAPLSAAFEVQYLADLSS